jgi:hypothetical protein
MFRPPIFANFREVFFEGYITRTSKPIYEYKIFLNIRFKIDVKIKNAYKIIFVEFLE